MRLQKLTLFEAPPSGVSSLWELGICAIVGSMNYPSNTLHCRYEADALWIPKLVASGDASRLLTLASR